ncbi:heme exporter protein CcmD [Bartonella sp. B10]
MFRLNNIQSSILGNLSQKIDLFLTTLCHEQIVILSYIISAISLVCLIGYILRKNMHQKKILRQLKEKEQLWKKKYNEKHPYRT